MLGLKAGINIFASCSNGLVINGCYQAEFLYKFFIELLKTKQNTRLQEETWQDHIYTGLHLDSPSSKSIITM